MELSPISMLLCVPGIFENIFAESCSKPQDNDITDVNGTQSMILASICQDWRDIALSMSEIWSRFQFRVVTLQDLDNLLQLVRLHLERSGSFPLTFAVVDDGIDSTRHFDDLLRYFPLVDLLFEHAQHWGDVALLLDEKILYPFFERVEDFPMLHTFRTVDHGILTTSAFLRAPILRHLEFTNSHVFPSKLEFPWSQIVSISISCGFTDILEILRYSTQLRHLQIRGAMYWIEGSSSVETFYLQSLCFTVSNGGVERFEGILNRIALPSAVRVKVALEEHLAVGMPHKAFTQFLGRCKSLKELTIHRFKMTYQQLFEYPLIAPSIARLEAAINQDITTEEFQRAVDQLFAQNVQLNEVQILGFDDESRAEYRAMRSESHGISTTVTRITAGG